MRNASKLWLPVALGLAFGLASLWHSMRQGFLAVPVLPDDIGYFAEAARVVQLFYDRGAVAVLRELVVAPPHSPLALAVPFTAYLLFGMQYWAAAALNIGWVVLLLCGLRIHLAERRWYEYLSVAAGVLAWPIAGFLVVESRPDVVYGVLLALATLYVLSSAGSLSTPRGMLSGALLFAAAFLAKPSALPLTLALMGTAMLFATLRDASAVPAQGTRLANLVPALRLAGVTALLTAPYFALAGASTLRYIWSTTFGAEKEIWSLDLSVRQHLLYYVSGPGGRSIYGAWLLVTGLLGTAALLIAWRRGWRPGWREMGVLAAIAITYAVLTATGHKSIYFGFTLGGFALLLFVAACRYLFAAGDASPQPRLRGGILAALLMATAAWLFHWHWYHRSGGAPSIQPAAEARARHDLVERLADAIAPVEGSRVDVFMPTATGYLNQATLRFELLRRRQPFDSMRDLHRSNDLAAHRALIDGSTHVVLHDPADPQLIAYLPSTALLGELHALLEASPDFRRIALIPGAPGEGSVSVYAKPQAFSGIVALQGFQQAEGPYPQWNLPRVRWATGLTALVQARRADLAAPVLKLRAQSPLPDQSIRASVAGKSIGECPIPTPGVVVDCVLTLPADVSSEPVRLDFAKALGPADGRRSVLFHWIGIEDGARANAPR